MMLDSVWNRWLSLLARLVVGGAFLYACIEKLQQPARFAEVIHNYRLLPIALENIFALVLPTVELGLALLLVAGFLTRSGGLVATVLLAVFIIAIGINLWRGVDISCGCFTLSEEGRHLGWMTLAVDVVLLLASLHVLARPFSPLSIDAALGHRTEADAS